MSVIAVAPDGSPYFRGRVPDKPATATASPGASPTNGAPSTTGAAASAPKAPSRVSFDVAPGKMQLRLSVEGAASRCSIPKSGKSGRFDKPNELTVGWQIAPGHYLYRDKLSFRADGKIELGRASLPKGKPHKDENFGDVEVYYDYVEAKIPFARASANALDVVLTAGFQGCRENSVCYPPSEQTMALVLPATSEFPADAAAGSASAGEPVSEQDRYVERIVNGSWWTMLGVFFLAGLALSLTPCVSADGADPVEHHRGPRRNRVDEPRVPALARLRARHGRDLHGRGRARGARWRPDPGDVPETVDHRSVRGAVLRARARHVRFCSSCRCRLRSKPASRGSRTGNAAARSSASR